MSALGQKQTSDGWPLMSALPPKADIAGRQLDVRLWQKQTFPENSIIPPFGLSLRWTAQKCHHNLLRTYSIAPAQIAHATIKPIAK